MHKSPSSFFERVIGAIRLDPATSEEVEHVTDATFQATVGDRQRRCLGARARGKHWPHRRHSGRGVPSHGRGAGGYRSGIRHQFRGCRQPDTALDVMP
jgi:hypothetical protein